LTINKIKSKLRSFPNKLIIIIVLITITAILLLTKFFLKDDQRNGNNTKNSEEVNNGNDHVKPDLELLENNLEPGIDSVFANFGIKKEWITTQNIKNQKLPVKTPLKDAEWFTKTVLIPKDLSSIEVNADLSRYIKGTGLQLSVNENIITKDIVLVINNPDSAKLPLAKIFVNHSDKITRDGGTICIILNNIGEYKQEEIEKLLLNKSEFSFVFPRNLDEIDTQNKLLHNKKDVLINLTVGGKDDYESDFNTSLDEKGIREKVKSFSSDFPAISKVILTRTGQDIQPSVMRSITEELNKFNISVVNDSDLTKLLTKQEEESRDRLSILTDNLKSKTSISKNIIAMLSIDPGEFEHFYDEVMILKKSGYKFYNFTEFMNKKTETDKQVKLDEEKLKEQKEQKIKHDIKKTDKKNTTIPKQPDKKQQKTKTSTNDRKKK